MNSLWGGCPFWRGCFDVEKMLVIQVAPICSARWHVSNGILHISYGMFRSWKQSKCWSNTMYLTNWWLHKLSWLLLGPSCHQYTISYICRYTFVYKYYCITSYDIYIYVCLYLYAYTIIDFLLYIIFHVSINLLYIILIYIIIIYGGGS